jgi:hypothetical protein
MGTSTFSITTFVIMTLSIWTLSKVVVLLCHVSFMLSVSNKTFMTSVVMLNVIMLNVVAPIHEKVNMSRGLSLSFIQARPFVTKQIASRYIKSKYTHVCE